MKIANLTLSDVEIKGAELATNSVVNKLIHLIDQYSILTAIQKISTECTPTLSYDGERYVINIKPKAIN